MVRAGRLPRLAAALRLRDVDTVNWRQMKVRSSKTEHHEGGDSRVVPIFAELRPYFEEAWELAPEGAVHVIGRYRDADVNLRTGLIRIIERAGLTRWPKLWQNLRATRATELAREFPRYAVTKWLGHTEEIAEQHYWQVTKEDFDRAVSMQRAAKAPQPTLGAELASCRNE